jgi:hypothetical protein
MLVTPLAERPMKWNRRRLKPKISGRLRTIRSRKV